MKGRTLVSSSSVSLGGKLRTRAGEGLAQCHTASLVRAGNGILITPKPRLLSPRSTADEQLTGTKEENEGAGGEGTGQAQNGTGVQPVTNPVSSTTPFDAPIGPTTQAGQEHVTPLTGGETTAEERTRPGLGSGSIPW